MRNLRTQRYHHRVVARHFRLKQRRFGFDHAPKPAPEVHLPGESEIEIVESEIILEKRYVVVGVFAEVDVRGRPGYLLHLRELPAGRDPELSVGLQHTKSGTS